MAVTQLWLGTPKDVPRAALFLVSEEAAWTMGIIRDVAGGAVLVETAL